MVNMINITPDKYLLVNVGIVSILETLCPCTVFQTISIHVD